MNPDANVALSVWLQAGCDPSDAARSAVSCIHAVRAAGEGAELQYLDGVPADVFPKVFMPSGPAAWHAYNSRYSGHITPIYCFPSSFM